MKKKIDNHGIIKVLRTSSEAWTSLAAMGFSVFLIVLGVFGLYAVQTSIDKPQDFRRQASVDQGMVTVSVGGLKSLTANRPNELKIYTNTGGLATNGIQLVFNVITDTLDTPPVPRVVENRGLVLASSQVQETADGYLVVVILTPPTPGTAFSSSSDDFDVLILEMNPTRAGSIQLNFDPERSYSTEFGTLPPVDQLTHVSPFTTSVTDLANYCVRAGCNNERCVSADKADQIGGTCLYEPEFACYSEADYGVRCERQASGECGFTLTDSAQACLDQYRDDASPTPTPTPSPTPTSNPTPTPSPDTDTSPTPSPETETSPTPSPSAQVTPTPSPDTSPDPTPTPSPTPSPDTGDGTGGGTSCNAYCDSNDDCASNYRCYYNQCRLATNVSSNTCRNPGDQGLNRSCNEYCANTGECGGDNVCWYNRCRNPLNVENEFCAELTNIQYQTYISSCNQGCATNNDCASNLLCYYGSCRLATNPGSTSCTPATKTTVSTIYTKGQTPKGGNFMSSPDTDATGSGDLTASPNASAQPATSTKPTYSDQSADGAQDETALQAIIRNLQARGIGFPLAMIASGLLLLLLLWMLFAAAKGNNQKGDPTQVRKRPISPKDQKSMNNIQQRINSLQNTATTGQKPTAAAAATTGAGHSHPTPTRPSTLGGRPLPRKPLPSAANGVQSVPPRPPVQPSGPTPPPVIPQQPLNRPPVAPTGQPRPTMPAQRLPQAPVPPTPTQSDPATTTSMIDKLKSRGKMTPPTKPTKS